MVKMDQGTLTEMEWEILMEMKVGLETIMDMAITLME